MPDDGTIKLGYDGKKVEAGFASLESRSKKSAKAVEGHFAALSSRISTSFKNLGTGIAQGIGQSLWQTAIRGASQLGKEIGGYDISALTDGLINANGTLDNLLDRATKLGTSAESLQRLELFGAVNGKAPEEMVDALARLNRSLADVGENKSARAAFATLGLDIENFARLEPDQQLLQLARAFQTAEKNGTGLTEIYDLLGRGGGGLLQVLRQPVDDLNALAGAKVIPEAVVLRASQIADDLTRAADAKTKAVIQARTELQLSDEQRKNLEAEAAARQKSQQAIRDATAEQIKAAAETAEEDDPAAKRDAEAEKRRAQALADLQAELQIIGARNSGEEKRAVQLEREKRVKDEIRRITEETGLSEDKARQAAEAKIAAEDKAAAAGDEADGPRRRFGSAFDGVRSRIGDRPGGRSPRARTIYDATFGEFFGNQPLENGQRPRNALSGFNTGGFVDPGTGRRSPKRDILAPDDRRVKLADDGGITSVLKEIKSELQRITVE